MCLAVHPRWRGEHAIARLTMPSRRGSSPLARGTLGLEAVSQIAGRFIPADAGNTWPLAIQLAPPSVHPRWRGEHAGTGSQTAWSSGSSPLARGTRHLIHPHDLAHRFIPAGAGNTRWRCAPGRSCYGSSPLARGTPDWPRPPFSHSSVHPRWRGEHVAALHRCAGESGSSPLARGTRRSPADDQCSGRFIPAGAGNTTN